MGKLLELNSLLLALGLGGITGFCRLIYKQVKKSREQAQSSRERTEERFRVLEYANVAILHDKIYKQCTVFLEDGWISVDDMENLEYLWRGYKKLGGNGTGETLYKKVLLLPNVKEEK
ncbi:hypothetical protein ACVN9X_03105 [Enterococcus dispar]|uniref:Uncharacterized protein n=1 Tax=Enterococcus dispar ATCC 51266 TaxID=1139219 RepID=S1NXS6_9ENTE|nr:hypothetical protein [Enterococcus dispar]EOT42593.1 hypothetical protein OMK_00954 [Enterococcus dispar ATCC 51266]EOW84956.1 hypothetical protein I569_00245 [Enterococcus dispar ATCC 51266]